MRGFGGGKGRSKWYNYVIKEKISKQKWKDIMWKIHKSGKIDF